MASQVTVTAKAGPALQATSLVLGAVTYIIFDLVARVVQVGQGSQPTNGPYKEFDLVGVTTVEFTISGANYTMTIS
jgi:hypothetical protein